MRLPIMNMMGYDHRIADIDEKSIKVLGQFLLPSLFFCRFG